MKTIEEVLAYLAKCEKEHQDVMASITADMAKLRDNLKGLNPDDKVEPKLAIELMTLKDRSLFHKSCLLVLQDVTNTINGVASVVEKVEGAVQAVEQKVENVVNEVKTAVENAEQTVANEINKVEQAVEGAKTEVQAVDNTITAATDAVKQEV